MKKILLFVSFLCFGFQVAFAQDININVIKNIPSCDGVCCGSAEVSISGTNPPFSYLWSNGSTSTGIFNLISGTYTVTITDGNGMTKEESIVVGELSVRHTITESMEQSCFGEEDVILRAVVTEGLPTYLFKIYDGQDNLVANSQPTSDSIFFFENLQGGTTYRTVISDGRACLSDVFFTTEEKLEFQIQAGDDLRLPLGESFQLQANFSQLPNNINWSPTDFLSCTDCHNPVVTPLENICYVVEAMNEDGCLTTDSICIEVETTALNQLTSSKKNTFHISPNPVQHEINVEGNFGKNVLINIFNAQGKEVLALEKFDFQNQFTLPVAQLSRGIYFLKIRNEEDVNWMVQKFVKLSP